MSDDRTTANLPASDMGRTAAFYAALGFGQVFRSDDWMILLRRQLALEFLSFSDVDKWNSSFSACIRVDDLDKIYLDFLGAGLFANPRDIPRLTAPVKLPGVPRMFPLVDADGSLLRCLENGDD